MGTLKHAQRQIVTREGKIFAEDWENSSIHLIGNEPLLDVVTTAETQTITNKTLTSPTINGTIATTGLTLPAVTLGGNMTLAGASGYIVAKNSSTAADIILNMSTVSSTWRLMPTGTNGQLEFNNDIGGATLRFHEAGNVQVIKHLGVVQVPDGDNGIYYNETYTFTDNATKLGAHSVTKGQKTSAAYSGIIVGVEGVAIVAPSNTQNWTALPSLQGVVGYIGIETGATGVIAHGACLISEPVIVAATLTNCYGLYVIDATGAGTVTNQYGVYIPALTRGATSNWGIYNVSAPVYLGLPNGDPAVAGQLYYTAADGIVRRSAG